MNAPTSRKVNMKIIDVLRTATSEHEIRFLLTAYVEAVRYGSGGATEAAYMLPLGDLDDVRARIAALESVLAHPARSAHGTSHAIAQEAAAVFRVALQRLHALDADERRRTCLAA